MTTRVTIGIYSSGGTGQKDQEVSFEARDDFTQHQVRAAAKHIKRIAPDYVEVSVENSEEITKVK